MGLSRKARRCEKPKPPGRAQLRKVNRRRRRDGGLRHPGPCPQCGDCEPRIVDSSEIYNGRSFGFAWICGSWPDCRSYVGCHPGTDLPLGTLADGPLRRLRHDCHLCLDPIWQRKATRDHLPKHEARGAAYRWLADQLGIERPKCHFGMFDLPMCWRAIEVMAPYSEHARATLRKNQKGGGQPGEGKPPPPAPEGATPR